jgi:Zn-dependent protease
VIGFDPLTVLWFVVSLVPAVVLHEVSHGVVADRMGDTTPRVMGRLSINPARHVDAFGTVVLPGLLLLPRLFGQPSLPVFAYAKPMPINPANLRNPDRQMVWIALAGPVTNLVLAVLGAVVFRFTGGAEGPAADLVIIFILVNVILAAFNLIPIPPLDGSKVLARFLPPRAREFYVRMEPYGALFILLIFFLLPGPIFAIVDPVVRGLTTLLLG